MLFVDRILNLISEKGITKNKLLRDLDLSKNSFVNWQNRGTVPNAESLSKIADYFGVSTDYLLGKTDIKTEPVKIEEEQVYKIKKLFEEKGLPFDERTVGFFLDFVAANAEIIKKQVEENK